MIKSSNIEKYYKYIVILLLLVCFLQVFFSIQNKSLVQDEFVHIPAGYAFCKTGEIKISAEHPPLIRSISALPLLFLDPKLPTSLPGYQEEKELVTGIKTSFVSTFFELNKENLNQLVLLARIPIIILSLILGFFVFKWTKEFFGIKAGLFALFLYSFSPNILAHSGLATVDLGVSLFIFLSFYLFYKFLKNPNIPNTFLSALVLGLAQLSKMSALILYPLFIIILITFHFKSRKQLQERDQSTQGKQYFWKFILIIILSILILNLGYLFKGSFTSIKNYSDMKEREEYQNLYRIAPTLASFTDNLLENENINWLSLPFPKKYVLGLGFSLARMKDGQTNFLYGQISEKGFLSYYPIAFLIKTPLSLIIFFILALAWYARRRLPKFENLFLLIPIVFIFLINIFSNLQLGLRYILPVYPFIFVFTGQVVKIFDKKRWYIIAFILLIAWYLLSNILIFPHYLAYFNELIGGPSQGYKYLVGPDLDWGQDLLVLKKYMEKNNIHKIKLSYFGPLNPKIYGINYETLGCQPEKGMVAISVTHLQGLYPEGWKDNYQCFSWLKKYQPKDKIGYSIFVYDIKDIK